MAWLVRFHRQLKAAIMAHESLNPSTTTLPAVLLGARSAVKELLGRSAAEMIYRTTLRLPGEFTQKYTVDAHTDLENYSDKLRVAMSVCESIHVYPYTYGVKPLIQLTRSKHQMLEIIRAPPMVTKLYRTQP